MTRQEQLTEVGRILALPRRKRWLAARDFALKINPHARLEHKTVLESVKEERAALHNDFAAGKEGMRWGLRFPESIWATIKMFDPEFDRKSNPNQEKKELATVVRTFPEYSIPRRF